jgi:hypothetical protein
MGCLFFAALVVMYLCFRAVHCPHKIFGWCSVLFSYAGVMGDERCFNSQLLVVKHAGIQEHEIFQVPVKTHKRKTFSVLPEQIHTIRYFIHTSLHGSKLHAVI